MGNQKSGNGVIALLVLIVIILSVLVVLTGTGVVSFKNNSNDDVQISDDSNVSSNENDVKQKSSVSKSQILSYYKEKISDLSTSDNLY